jgi:tetratricopeptide (TPR) repeat protein
MQRLRFPVDAMLAVILLACLHDGRAGAQTASESAQVVQLLHNGRDAVQRGDLSGAEIIFRQAIDIAPTLSDCYLGLGLVQLRRGEVDDAVRSLSHATELNPKLPGAHLFLGITRYQIGEIEPAAASLRAEIALQPSNGEALSWLGIVELGAGHPERATEPLDRALELSPKDPHVMYYCARAHMLVAESVYRQLSQLDPDSALVHRGMAESFDIAGQPEKAIAEYEAAIRKEPANPDLYDALGEANQKMSRVDAARAAYEQELKLNPHSALALYNLGKIDVERGKPESGVALLRKAEAAHASAAATAFYLGLGLAELGQNAEAAQWLEKALANQPSPFIEQGAWYQLVRVYPKLNRKADAQHALTELKRLLDLAQKQKDATAKEAVRASTPAPDAAGPPNQP